ncbi:MAG: hypothetical protein HQK52_01615 [Oligoflexia bacterium]|nr:hypothetical protein [Oligoflexia bacterium]
MDLAHLVWTTPFLFLCFILSYIDELEKRPISILPSFIVSIIATLIYSLLFYSDELRYTFSIGNCFSAYAFYLFISIRFSIPSKKNNLLFSVGFVFLLIILAYEWNFNTVNKNKFFINIPLYLIIFSIFFIRKYRITAFTAKPFKLFLPLLAILLLVIQVRFMRYFGLGNEGLMYEKYLNMVYSTNLIDTQSSPFRVGSVDFDYPCLLQIKGLESVESRSPIFNRYYKDLFGLAIEPQLKDKKHRKHFDEYWYDLYLGIDLDSRQDLSQFFSVPHLKLLNLRYIFSLNPYEQIKQISSNEIKLLPQEKKKFLHPLASPYDKPIYIYEIKKPFPRFMFIPNSKLFNDGKDLFIALAQATESDLRQYVFLEKTAPLPPITTEKRSASADIAIKTYHPDYIKLEVTNPSPGFMLILNNYHPNWHASINGVKTKIFKADHAFQAVFLENSGKNNIELNFAEPIFYWSYLLSFLGFLFINFSLLIGFRSPPCKQLHP